MSTQMVNSLTPTFFAVIMPKGSHMSHGHGHMPTQRKNETCVNQKEEIMSKAQKEALDVRKEELLDHASTDLLSEPQCHCYYHAKKIASPTSQLIINNWLALSMSHRSFCMNFICGVSGFQANDSMVPVSSGVISRS
jgi:hypothetical protein